MQDNSKPLPKIKLALIRQKYRTDGGAERFVSQAVTALIPTTNLDISIISRSWDGQLANSKLLQCNPPIRGRISREQDFAKAAKAIIASQNFDLVQSHERIPDCDIYRAGDGVHKIWLEQRCRILNRLKKFLLRHSSYHSYVLAAEKAMFNSSRLKAVICNSNMVKQEIIKHFSTPAERIHVIYNSVDSTKFYPVNPEAKQKIRQQLGLPTDKLLAIFVGSGFERKGLKAAIEAVATQTNWHLIVVGKDKKQPSYKKFAQQLHADNRIHFVGVQTQTLNFYQAADVLLLPTLYDPFPNVILEAMSCGLPVITSTKCGGAEFITDGCQGYVTDALNIEAIANSLSILQITDIRLKAGEAARAKVAVLTPEYLAQNLYNLYQQLLPTSKENTL